MSMFDMSSVVADNISAYSIQGSESYIERYVPSFDAKIRFDMYLEDSAGSRRSVIEYFRSTVLKIYFVCSFFLNL